MHRCILFVLLFPALHAAPQVKTSLGTVRGTTITFEGKKVDAYFGIPYAKPPLGPLRFKPPEPAKSWTGVYDATRRPPTCIQVIELLNIVGDEDCLFLSVYTPASRSNTLKPVMVWLYGGGFFFGSGNIYDGRVIVSYNDVVWVTLNYRLTALGFLSSLTEDAPGNVGILDQIQALKWVKENIKAFGGDPEQVTLLGESAGSMSVHAHLMSPLSKGLFHKAIMQSGTIHGSPFVCSPEGILERSNKLSNKLRCGSLVERPKEAIECLRSKKTSEIVNSVIGMFPLNTMAFFPSYNNSVIPMHPNLAAKQGLLNKVPLLIGANSEDFSFFLALTFPVNILTPSLLFVSKKTVREGVIKGVKGAVPQHAEVLEEFYLKRPEYQSKEGMRRAAIDMLTDHIFVCPSLYLAEHHSDANNSAFIYRFAHLSTLSPKPKWMGVIHAEELLYLLGVPFFVRLPFTSKDREMSRTMMKAWTDMAKMGKPTAEDWRWPAFNRENQIYGNMNNGNVHMHAYLRKEFCDYWRKRLDI